VRILGGFGPGCQQPGEVAAYEEGRMTDEKGRLQ
jgi:hypothetical protein